jgi:hypothetical protein
VRYLHVLRLFSLFGALMIKGGEESYLYLSFFILVRIGRVV